MLDQRRRRWKDVVQMLYKCFVLAGSVAKYDGVPLYPPVKSTKSERFGAFSE